MVNGLPSKQKLWVRFPLPVFKINYLTKVMSINSVYITSPAHTSTRRLTQFVRCGNKEGVENALNRLLKTYKVWKNPQPTTVKPSVVADPFQTIFLTATPFIGLKTRRRRRGKRLIAKIVPLERNRAERRAFLALAKSLDVTGSVSKPFSYRLARELENLSGKSTQGPDAKMVGASSAIREKRDEIHKLAFASRPPRWRTRRSR